MKLVISPAKSLDFETVLPTEKFTEVQFLDKSERLNKLLRKKSAKAISKLMKVSDNIGQLNYERFQNWELPFTPKNARPAIYAFSGDVYRGFDAYTLETSKLDTLESKVRILSGLYGILKPLDLIQPYRLEMGTKLPVGKNKNLYEFWKKDITAQLNEELEDDEVFVNLASNEYFKAIDTKTLKVPVINVAFKEYKNDTYKIVAIFAKLARGLMARYIVENNCETIEDLKGFRVDNYGFSQELSSDTELVFTR
ncbi:peroxide stress protein YaaA [Aurantibacter sp.]|uniref:peroxide stress protein YaaA n=1 Tax=Aurantibacter sp. TaxID=2807103 RepID=UPI0035C8727C